MLFSVIGDAKVYAGMSSSTIPSKYRKWSVPISPSG
jgi:hypothetical protein